MKIGVDVCIGTAGILRLQRAGHEVVAADHGESDRSWFKRAHLAGVEVVVSDDADISVLAYDNHVELFRPMGRNQHQTVAGLLKWARSRERKAVHK